jgi:hypothetical protein
LELYSTGKLDDLPPGYNSSVNFTNWAENVNIIYENILYPSDTPASTGKQISVIQQFVRRASSQGKRVRASGNRHSWSNIFADPKQYLASFYPFAVSEGTSDALEAYAAQMTQLEIAMAALNIEHLNEIRKVGEIDTTFKEVGKADVATVKHLIKIGGGVSNEQLRKWSIKNGFQYKSNTGIV